MDFGEYSEGEREEEEAPPAAAAAPPAAYQDPVIQKAPPAAPLQFAQPEPDRNQPHYALNEPDEEQKSFHELLPPNYVDQRAEQAPAPAREEDDNIALRPSIPPQFVEPNNAGAP